MTNNVYIRFATCQPMTNFKTEKLALGRKNRKYRFFKRGIILLLKTIYNEYAVTITNQYPQYHMNSHFSWYKRKHGAAHKPGWGRQTSQWYIDPSSLLSSDESCKLLSSSAYIWSTVPSIWAIFAIRIAMTINAFWKHFFKPQFRKFFSSHSIRFLHFFPPGFYSTWRIIIYCWWL